MNMETPKQAARKLAAKALSEGFKPEGLHTYPCESGQPIYWRIRLKHPKTGEKWIRPMRHDGQSFVLGEPRFENGKPLYRLDLLSKNLETTIWIVEGEKCADALIKLGVIATTSGGADSADSANWQPLAGRTVIIWPDNDDPGRRYAKNVSTKLGQLQCKISLVDTDKLSLPPGGDVVDWHLANPDGTKEQLAALPFLEFKSNERETVDKSDAWDAPILFDNEATPDLPASILPGIYREFVAAISTATETPSALALMTVLGVLSTCLTKRFKVSPLEGWEESVNIYTIVALPPANNKSAVLKMCTEPLVLWEREQRELLEPEIKRQRSERRNEEKIIDSLRGKAARQKDPLTQADLLREITEREMNLIEPKVLPQLFVNDVTPEALGQVLYEQASRLAIFSDEGGLIETMSGLYTGGMANVDILLKGIDGGHVRVRRKDRSYDLNPYLTIVLTVQPQIISNMAAKRAFLGNGMLERFLWVIPQSQLGYRKHDKPPVSAAIKQEYFQAISRLLTIPARIENNVEVPYKLSLSAEACKEWREFQATIETNLRPNGELASCIGWGGKVCGFALRIAGILHAAENGCNSLEIGGQTMAHALDLSARLVRHAMAAYSLMGTDRIVEDAKEVLRWIQLEGKTSFTKTEITLAFRNRQMGRHERLGKALALLVERNIVRETMLPTRKPTTIYPVNPHLLSEALQ